MVTQQDQAYKQDVHKQGQCNVLPSNLVIRSSVLGTANIHRSDPGLKINRSDCQSSPDHNGWKLTQQ